MATNKLRKRLEEADEQTLSKLTENFCMIGTPLPRLDGKKDANEYKPVWQQEVLDEQGRRRFHGAFTGGYSAGYFNTVGSKEGWTPSTFRSSRKDKDKSKQTGGTVGNRPEDFMDEEDLESLREGRGALSSTQTYQMEQQQQQQKGQERDPLMDMLGLGQTRSVAQSAATTATTSSDGTSSLQVAPSSLGTKILQRMGWRQGQGLGPRISFGKRKELLGLLGVPVKVELEDYEEAEKHLWPPPDTPMPLFSTKADARGLGWNGERVPGGLNEALRRAREEEGKEKQSQQLARKGKTGGFGLGALEDDSDGEDDVYASGNTIEDSKLSRRSNYQWSSGNDQMVLGNTSQRISPIARSVKGPNQKDRAADENVWHDGSAMIAGFRIASRLNDKDPWFETPAVPSNWKPDPQLVWSLSQTIKSSAANNLSTADRASILGEARLPGPPPSILDYLSQKDKERLQRGKETAAAAALHKDGQSKTNVPSTDGSSGIPLLDPVVAKAALQGYKPFDSEPDKQRRYYAYLTSQVNLNQGTNTSPLQREPHQTQPQFIAELREFAKSASIFKPMSTIMASRFQSSVSGSNDLPQINPGLYIPEQKPVLSVEEGTKRAEEKRKEEEKRKREEEMETLTSFQRNARLGLFGKNTTREVKTWKPSRLLCKRFNVPMPFPEDEEGEETEQREQKSSNVEGIEMEAAFGATKMRRMDVPKVNAKWEASKRQLQELAAQRSKEIFKGQPEHAEGRTNSPSKEEVDTMPEENKLQSKGVLDLNNIGLGEVEGKQEEAEYVKPSMDVFKAVFADDDDSDEEEKEEIQDKGEEFPITGPKSSQLDAAVKETSLDGSSASSGTEGVAQTMESFKPTFVPRKRRAEDGEVKKEKRKKEKKATRKGLLTFSVDEDGEDDAATAVAAKEAKAKPNRPRAADLFN